jgi:hypothetical protein
MRVMPRQVLALVFAITVASPPVMAQDQSPHADDYANTGMVLPSNGPMPRTGKERLSEKWMDEQRIDNCKVPIDKRGTKLRPDTCAHAPTR